eukprot:5514488-Amphidinium_carterae.1
MADGNAAAHSRWQMKSSGPTPMPAPNFQRTLCFILAVHSARKGFERSAPHTGGDDKNQRLSGKTECIQNASCKHAMFAVHVTVDPPLLSLESACKVVRQSA